MRQGTRLSDISRYLAHRFIRILPPYLLAIGFAGMVFYSIVRWHLSFAPDIINPGITPIEVLKQLLFLDQRPHLLNAAFWSLAVEFRWYFLFPLLLLLWTKSPRAFGLVLVAFVFLAYFTRAASLDLFMMPGFMLGIIAADMEVRQLPIRNWSGLFAILAICVSVAASRRISPIQYWCSAGNSPAFSLSSQPVPILGCGWALSFGPLVVIGIISYSLYLVQSPVIGLVATNTSWGYFGIVVPRSQSLPCSGCCSNVRSWQPR